MRHTKLLCLAALLCLSVTNVSAQDPSADNDPMSAYREAGATPEQQTKIRDLAKDFEATMRVKVARVKNLLKRMQDFSLQPDPNSKAVLDTQEEINGLQADMALTRVKLMLQIRSLLSPEQKLRLVELMKQRQTASGGSP